MKKFSYTITDAIGIHARPAGNLAKEVKNYQSKITLSVEGKMADATRIMAVMGLGAKKGTEVLVSVEGEDENVAAVAMEAFFKENL